MIEFHVAIIRRIATARLAVFGHLHGNHRSASRQCASNQSASRSLMGRFVPERHQAEFFGFFQFSGKATSFVGPILLGTAAQVFGSQRVGVATVLVFFLVGAMLLATVNEQEALAAARGE